MDRFDAPTSGRARDAAVASANEPTRRGEMSANGREIRCQRLAAMSASHARAAIRGGGATITPARAVAVNAESPSTMPRALEMAES